MNTDFLMFSDFFLVKLTEQIKSDMGNMSEKLEAMRNSITENGGQFPKNEFQAKFNNSLSQANF